MTLSYFNTAVTPADNGTNAGAACTITPPASMVAGDIAIVLLAVRYTGLGFGEATITNTGGQQWQMITENFGTTNLSMQVWACRFNGTWSADPAFDGVVSTCVTGKMTVIHSDDSSKTIDMDVTWSSGNYTSTGTTKTATGITTRTDGAFVYVAWACTAARTWSNLTATWTNCGSAYYRNTSGSDLSISDAYKVISTAGSTGNISNDQNTGTAGSWVIFAFCEQSAYLASVPTVDVYIDAEGGSNGDVVTTTILADMTHPASPGGTWSSTGAVSTTKVATAAEKSLGRSLTCGGTTYSDPSGTRGISYDHTLQSDQDSFAFTFTTSKSKVSIGFLIKCGQPFQDYRGTSLMALFSTPNSHFAVFNYVAQFAAQHISFFETDTGTTIGPYLDNSTWYWVTLLYDGAAGVGKMAIFLPDSSWKQLGFTVIRNVTAENLAYVQMLVTGGTPENRGSAGLDYYDDIMFDWTSATFPLGPGVAGGATPIPVIYHHLRSLAGA